MKRVWIIIGIIIAIIINLALSTMIARHASKLIYESLDARIEGLMDIVRKIIEKMSNRDKF